MTIEAVRNHTNSVGLIQADTDPVSSYFREINRIKLLTAEEEKVLGRRVQAGLSAERRVLRGKQIPSEELDRLQTEAAEAKTTLIEGNLRLVVSVAKKYQSRGLPLPDLIQEGNIGLGTAIDKFDPERGCKVSTHATWWIRQAITRAIDDQARTVRLPVHIIDGLNEFNGTEKRLVQVLGRNPELDEIAAEMGADKSTVEKFLTVARPPLSLDEPLTGEDEGYTWEDKIEDPDCISPEDNAVQARFNDELGIVVEGIIQEKLSEREGDVLRKRFGLGGERFHTLEEIGEKYKVTRERVRQIEAIALRKLKDDIGTRIRLEGYFQ